MNSSSIIGIALAFLLLASPHALAHKIAEQESSVSKSEVTTEQAMQSQKEFFDLIWEEADDYE